MFNNKKTLIISVPYGISARSILRSDVFAILKNKDINIVIITPAAELRRFTDEFKGKNIYFEKYIPFWPSLLEKIIRNLKDMIFFERYKLNTWKLKRNKLKYHSRFKYLGTELLRILFGRCFWLYGFLEKLDQKTCIVKYYDQIFKKYKPEVFFSTYAHSQHEKPIMASAKRYGAKTITYVFSWDNVTSKSPIPFAIDEIIVWNNLIKEELKQYFGYPEHNIAVCGVPQFDIYTKKELLQSREEFFRNNGLDINKKLITLGGTSWVDSEPDIVDILRKAIHSGAIVYPAQILIRLYPRDNPKRFAKFFNLDDVKIERPGRDSNLEKGNPLNDEWDPDIDDAIHTMNLLAHSDILLTYWSTIVLDAACLDTPIINIAFDGYRTKPYCQSAVSLVTYSHIAPVLQTKGAIIARDKDELIRLVNSYLSDKNAGHNDRIKMLEQQCYRIDGRSGERIADMIYNLISRTNHR